MLELHPDATKNFNEKAEELFHELEVIPKESIKVCKDSFEPDYFISGHITDKDIEGEVRHSIKETGNEIAKNFYHNNKVIAVRNENYDKLFKLSYNMQRTEELKDKVSFTILTDLIFDWMKDKYKNNIDLSMVEYVLTRCEEIIQESEVWIPIALLYIESELRIGNITLKPITKEVFNNWYKIAGRNCSENFKNAFYKSHQKVQGLAGSTIKLSAEPKRAFEIALEETEKSIAILRFFSVGSLDPELTSYCSVFGKENIESTKHFIIINEGESLEITESLVDESFNPWLIDNKQLSEIKKMGLDRLSSLLNQEKRTDFQQKLLDSIILYSRACLAKDIVGKFVYIFATLESMLLKDMQESIQQNIGERMAFIISKDISERKAIIKNFKDVYKLRSSFFHHGQIIEDIKTLKEFMSNAWKLFLKLIDEAYNFETQEQLFDAVENIKLGGN